MGISGESSSSKSATFLNGSSYSLKLNWSHIWSFTSRSLMYLFIASAVSFCKKLQLFFSANASYCRARCVLSPLSCCSCWAPYEKEDRICISASLSSFSVSISVWSGASIALIAFHSVLFPRRNREAWPAFSQVRPIPKNCVSFSLDAASLMTIFLSKALVAIATPPFGMCIPYI